MITVIIIVGVVLIVASALFWWLIIASEGVYLGRWAVIWLYDLYAKRYDRIKQFHPRYEHILLAAPLMHAIEPHQSPLVLDVATGTGRLPLALLDHILFQGRVVGVDLSVPMLHEAAEKLAEDNSRVDLLCLPAEDLPFHDNAFDVVTCLESLEFMADNPLVLAEMARVLRPGGLLLVTNRINTRWMPGKTYSDDAFVALLESIGFINVRVDLWQVDYRRVLAWKSGESPVSGARPLEEVLRLAPETFAPDDAGILHPQR